jgi:CheY-like chemotaxis protein
MLMRALKIHAIGKTMDEASDGLQAIQLVSARPASSPYDLILMDNAMPNMGGREATKIIREQGFAGLIVGLTGNTMDAIAEEFIDCGADAVLLKPLEVAELIAVLQAHTVAPADA